MRRVSRKRRKRRKKNKKGLSLVAFALFVICIGVASRTVLLKKQSKELAQKEASLESQIKVQEERAKELEELEKYMQTKKYMEEVAREKLGLVYPDEILIAPEKE